MKLNALNPLLLFTFLSFSVAVLSQYYEANLEFDNKVPILEPIDNKNADSLVRCAMLCGSGCKCFSFNHYTGMCRSYNSCHILNMTSEAGWQFYRSPSLKTIGKWLLLGLLFKFYMFWVFFLLFVWGFLWFFFCFCFFFANSKSDFV